MPLTAEAHATRNQGLGSSDAAVAVGMSPFKSPAELWLEKTGRKEPDDLDGLDHIRFGNVLEDIIAKEFAHRTDKKIQRMLKPYVRVEGDLQIVANIDRYVVNEDAVLEIKNVNAFAASHWEEGPPLYYRLQVEHQLIAAKKDKAWIAALIGGNSFVCHELQRNDLLSKNLIKKEQQFWQYVVDDTPPPARTAEEVLALYPRSNGKPLVATDEIVTAWEKLLDVRTNLKEIEAQKRELETVLKVFMGESGHILLMPDNTKMATFNTNKDRVKIDWKEVARAAMKNLPETTREALVSSFTETKPGARPFIVKGAKA